MKSGILFEQRQIFTANVIYSDQSANKIRPVVIISHNKHNKSSDDLICCPITSEIKGRGRIISPSDYEVEKKTLPIPQSEIKSLHPMIIHKSKLNSLKTGRVKITKELAKKIVKDIEECIAP